MIRKAGKSDAAAIERLMKSESGFWNDNWPSDALSKVLRSRDAVAAVFEENGELLGFACGHDLGFRGYLSELIVAGSARGKGIGSGLAARIVETLKSRGCPVVISDVWKSAEPFYRKSGWTPPDVVLLARR